MSTHKTFIPFLTHRKRRRRAALALVLALDLLFGFVLPTAPNIFRPQTAEAVLYSPLNNYRPKDHAIIRKDGVWHVFSIYVCIDQTPPCDTTPQGLMHLTSTDLKNWTEVGYVVPPGTTGQWDDYDTWAPSVVERNGTYYMFYTGVDQNGFGTLVQKIGIATSTDLNTWVKYGSNPVVNCDNFSWAYWDETNSSDGAACRDPYVFWDQSEHQWVMLLSGRTGAGTMVIGLATSEDLLTWREYGYIATTANGTAESAHYIEHSGTHYVVYTDNQTIDLKYVSSSTSLYTGYGAEAETSLEDNAYASEYYKDLDGREYFTRIDGTTNQRLDFDELVWTGSPFTVQEPSYGKIGDAVWSDTNGDGVYDGGEAGIDNVTVKLYLDDGDGLFDVNSDDLYATKTTGDDPNTGGTQHGYYQFTEVLPNDYWVHIDPTNYNSGNALSGLVATTTNTTASAVVTDNLTISNIDIGFVAMGTTWPLTTGGNFTVNSEATLASGRATTAVTTGTPGWWDSNWQYRRQVTVTAGSGEALGTSYTMDLAYNVSSLVSAGKVQADYDDLRLAYWNGSANIEVDLDVLDGDTQRFKVQSAISTSASDSNYYLYYGNPDVTRKPAYLALVYDYYASFNEKDQTTYGSWTESTADWSIVGNRWKFSGTAVAADRFTRDTSKTFTLSDDWNLEATTNINSGGQIAALTYHSTQAFGNEEYHNNFDAANDRIQVFHWAFGQISTNQAYTINTGQDYRLRSMYSYISSTLRQIISFVDDTVASTKTEFASSTYDIWWQGSCPCTDKIANPSLGVFNSQSSFNDVKAWQNADGSSANVSGTETPLYPTRTGTLQPVAGQALTFGKLTGFRASTLEQSGTVRFILSNDGGTAWYYHNGSSWVTSDGTSSQANTAAEINTNAASFPAGGKSLLWRAVLTSASNQFPTLLQVGASVNVFAGTPTLISPADASSPETLRPTFTFSATDPESESLQYEIQFDTVSTFDSANLRTYAQSTSQTGWSGQDAGSGTQYTSGATATFVPPDNLMNGTNYWRVRANDPDGSNVYGSYSGNRSLTAPGALTLSNIVASADAGSAGITWLSSNPGNTRVEYGFTSGYGSTFELNDSVTSHSAGLTALALDTDYHYRVATTDIYGQTTFSSDATFRTLGTLIANVLVERLTPEKVRVSWTTNEPATTILRYGRTADYGNTLANTVASTSHSVLMTGLRPLTTYHFQIESDGSSTATEADRTVLTYAEWVGRAIPPTLLQPFVQNGRDPAVIVVGVARGSQLVRIFIDGKIVARVQTTGSPSSTKSFAKKIDLDGFPTGAHTLYAQSTDQAGRTSLIKQRIGFSFGEFGAKPRLGVEATTKYVVKTGDSMWKIAATFLGQGSRYTEIVAANLAAHPSLRAQPNVLQVGWVLTVPAR